MTTIIEGRDHRGNAVRVEVPDGTSDGVVEAGTSFVRVRSRYDSHSGANVSGHTLSRATRWRNEAQKSPTIFAVGPDKRNEVGLGNDTKAKWEDDKPVRWRNAR